MMMMKTNILNFHFNVKMTGECEKRGSSPRSLSLQMKFSLKVYGIIKRGGELHFSQIKSLFIFIDALKRFLQNFL
jgi:hypothetical protein